MKKFLKSRTFSFLLGAIIFGFIGAASAANFFASSIPFTPTDTSWTVDNVSDALDDLKNDIARFDNLEVVSFQGNRGKSRTLTKELTRGKYVVVIVDAVSATPSSRHTTTLRDFDTDTSLTCNHCSIVRKTAKYVDVSATGTSNSGYQSNYYFYSLYEVKIAQESDIITYVGYEYPAYNTLPQNIQLYIYH